MLRLLFATLLVALVLQPSLAKALSDLDYLPENIRYNPQISLPEAVLGAPVGQWHVRHDQLVAYMRLLARQSDRVSLLETGRTHENRPLLLLAFAAPAQQARLAEIREAHLERVRQGKAAKEADPVVVWMGYSVHGDEASGANAAMLVAYYLAAAQSSEVEALLANNIVLLDPVLNPDGLSRFAQWANMHRGQVLVGDPSHREHRQAWPSGRTNHYWFDLNRDWLPLVHPESRARVAQYHAWRPHVLTDFHEMGSNSSYFFQPGIPSRRNPLTPERNVQLTQALAEHHAEALDSTKQLYFSQEAFDDFYYGKGSTYPDALGSVGILFEQASARGHLHHTENGALSFVQAIQNQVTTSLSTFAGVLANRQALLAYPQAFYTHTRQQIKNEDLSGYLVAQGMDKSKFTDFVNLLEQHQIAYQWLGKNAAVDKVRFEAGKAIFVPLDQPAYALVKSLFSTRKSFPDNSFYDVSNWNMALAYNLRHQGIERSRWRRLSLQQQAPANRSVPEVLPANSYAYAFSWHDSQAPAMLQSLLGQGIKVRVAGKAFAAKTPKGQMSFAPGTVIIPSALTQPADYVAVLNQAQQRFSLPIWPILSGLTAQGIDLGSRNMQPIEAPRILLAGGRGTSQYEAGEVWHLLDTRLGAPATVTDLAHLASLELDKYSHILLVDGNYQSVSEDTRKQLGNWLKQGGVLIGQKRASRWFAKNNWIDADFVSNSKVKSAISSKGLNYAEQDTYKARQRIAGAVFSGKLDNSHPLTFGIEDEQLPIFRNSTLFMQLPEQPFSLVAQYTDKPLLAGYTDAALLPLIKNTAALVAQKKGKGLVIAFADNPNFRGYWQGTSRLYVNAIYLSALLK